jgi:hypothetical protein
MSLEAAHRQWWRGRAPLSVLSVIGSASRAGGAGGPPSKTADRGYTSSCAFLPPSANLQIGLVTNLPFFSYSNPLYIWTLFGHTNGCIEGEQGSVLLLGSVRMLFLLTDNGEMYALSRR